MKIDWSEAPEGAQRHNAKLLHHWLKREDETISFYNGLQCEWFEYAPGYGESSWEKAVERPPKYPELDWKDAPDWATEIRESTTGQQFWTNDSIYSYDGMSHYRYGTKYDEVNPTLISLRPKSADEPKSALDTQEGGNHYKKLGAYQPWEVLQKWMTPDELRGHMKGTVIGYLSRERDKGGDLDIEKAAHTMQIYLEVVERYE